MRLSRGSSTCGGVDAALLRDVGRAAGAESLRSGSPTAIDDRPVDAEPAPGSPAAAEDTFREDLDGRPTRCGRRSSSRWRASDAALPRRAASSCARTVTLKVRYADFTTVTRSRQRRAGDARPRRARGARRLSPLEDRGRRAGPCASSAWASTASSCPARPARTASCRCGLTSRAELLQDRVRRLAPDPHGVVLAAVLRVDLRHARGPQARHRRLERRKHLRVARERRSAARIRRARSASSGSSSRRTRD